MTTRIHSRLKPSRPVRRARARTGGRVISPVRVARLPRRSLAAIERTARRPARRQPERRGTAPSGRVPVGIRSLAGHPSGRCALIMVVVLTIVFIIGWRSNPGSPVLMMVLVTTLIVWQDPIMNWAPYAVYNPELLHWPESWPLIMMSPTVEPFIVFGYVTFYFGPYFPAIWILRKLQAKRGPESFVWRHPLLSLGAADLGDRVRLRRLLEISLVRTGLYIYSQVDPVRLVLRRQHLPVPADLGVAVGDLRDDPGGHPRLPRRHRKVGGGEARCEGQAVPDEARARHVPGDVRDHQRRVLRLRRVVLRRSRRAGWPPRSRARGRIPEAKVYDPQGYYEKERRRRAVLGRQVVHVAAGAVPRRPARCRAAARPASGRCARARAEWLSRAASSSPARPGASGFASAAHLYREGWRVVAAMRSPGRGHAAAAGGDRCRAQDDDRLIGVQLDLDGRGLDRRGGQGDRRGRRRAIRPGAQRGYLRCRNGGGDADWSCGRRCSPPMSWVRCALTKALLPCHAGGGPGPDRHGVERGWGPRHARHRAVFRGQGSAGALGRVDGGRDRTVRARRDRPGDWHVRHRHHHRRGHHRRPDFDGPYAPLHNTMDTRGRFAMQVCRSPDSFADGVLKALEDSASFRRHRVGPDARCC